MPIVQLQHPASPADWELTRAIFQEYADSLGERCFGWVLRLATPGQF
jgi:hypothetical protein